MQMNAISQTALSIHIIESECIPGYHDLVYHINSQECYNPNIQLRFSTPNFLPQMHLRPAPLAVIGIAKNR
jgi:hypothetical protein